MSSSGQTWKISTGTVLSAGDNFLVSPQLIKQSLAPHSSQTFSLQNKSTRDSQQVLNDWKLLFALEDTFTTKFSIQLKLFRSFWIFYTINEQSSIDEFCKLESMMMVVSENNEMKLSTAGITHLLVARTCNMTRVDLSQSGSSISFMILTRKLWWKEMHQHVAK